ncbi:dihydropteroate synthase [Desulfonispora thiosulfatigenes DSM 11270]|uniref:Dihydropteroate synthase n=1 Tax=Desulfonispora thiosulfatigenes DSM 11270 TaxID=656914 RepID=A0A1W1VDU0_DESTI|nr:dihydropteroate synthase [Desulfonispora thiosulfatigenes]SMB91538.1 dihydropteroate synthase [Desulfonispora thiosulfatigenes DSM 11270]
MLIRPLSKRRNLINEIDLIGADKGSIPFFKEKAEILYFKIYGIRSAEANILKQELLSRGGDLVISHQCVVCKTEKTDALILATRKTLKQLINKLTFLPYWNLPKIKKQLEDYLKETNKDNLNLPKDRVLNIWDKPLLMGIINLTPDSFYAKSRIKKDDLLLKVKEYIDNGADILDIGGESTRPGSDSVSKEEELERVIPTIQVIRENFDIPISLDTYKAEVAREGIKVGADIINDISGFEFDENMVDVIKETGAPIVIMHMKGNPKNMQENPYYDDVIKEVCSYFVGKIEYALNNGVKREQIILDPGIGFGKRLEDNLTILKYMDEFKMFNLPILIGASRKSVIKDVLNLPVDERLSGTLAITARAAELNTNIIRVHDIRENRQVIDMIEAIKEVD